MFEYVALDGKTQAFTGDNALERAQMAYASAGFQGKIKRVSVPAAQAAKDQAGLLATLEENHGIAAPPTWFAPGTEMIEVGKQTFRTYAKNHEDLPLFRDSALAVAAQIETEDRRELLVEPRNLRMDETGRLARDGKRYIPAERRVLEQLVSRFSKAFPRGRALMLELPPRTRAQAFNAQMGRLSYYYGRNTDLAINLGVRRGPGGHWQAYRAVSKTYGDAPANALLRTYAELAGDDARGEVVYCGDTTDVVIRGSWHAPVNFDAKVGDIFRTGFNGRTNDAGQGSHFPPSVGITRIICINCTIAEARAQAARQVHRGEHSLERMQDAIRASLESARETADEFLASWGVLRATAYEGARVPGMRGALPAEPANLFEALVNEGIYDLGIARDAQVQVLLDSFAQEPGRSLADVVNAVSRAAHDELLDSIQRDVAERRAGALVKVLASSMAAEA